MWKDAVGCIERIWGMEITDTFLRIQRAAEYHNNDGRREILDITNNMKEDGASASDIYYCRAIIKFGMYEADGQDAMLDGATTAMLRACRADKKSIRNHDAGTAMFMTIYQKYTKGGHRQSITPPPVSDVLEHIIVLGKRAIELGSKKADTAAHTGQALFHVKEIDESIKYSEYAIKLDPKHADAMVMIGLAMAADYDHPIERYREALTYVNDAIKTGRSLQFALSVRADIQVMIDDKSGLRATLRQLEQFVPTHPADLMWRGELYMMAGDKKGAAPYIHRAIKLDPSQRLSMPEDMY